MKKSKLREIIDENIKEITSVGGSESHAEGLHSTVSGSHSIKYINTGFYSLNMGDMRDSHCNYCGTKAVVDKNSNCKNCGAPVK